MSKYSSFIFSDYDFQRETGTLSLRYGYEGGPAFEEKIIFPAPLRSLNESEEYALDQAFRLIFLLAGVSYYKAYIPSQLICRAFALDEKLARFCEQVYANGLGEFAYRNQVDLDIHFQVEQGSGKAPVPLALSDRVLVPVGGGKDSIVTIEMLKDAGKSITLFALGGGGELAAPIDATIKQSGLSFCHVKRIIAPQLLALNKQNALNGHVPITAILSVIAVACAILYDFKSVVLSNEGSANAPNLVCCGKEINHQYSKSLAFEKELAAVIYKNVSPDLAYFSFLRPLSETAIAKRFASYTAYHDVFRSCNTAFKQDEVKRNKNWCCDCPKCRFVFLALAPFMEKEKLVGLFGANLLDDPAQLQGYQALCGFSAVKPFECVGAVEESALLVAMLAQEAAWQNDKTVVELGRAVIDCTADYQSAFKKLLQPSGEHLLPPFYRELLYADQ